MNFKSHPDLLVGIDTHDDCSVYRISPDIAIVQSLDFFTPIVDDPFTFGQITAANALSDIYAMGARPITALNIVGFPVDELPKAILKDILRGGLDKVEESGAVLAGGHSIKDDELKYGLSVTGVVHPDKLMSNKGARPGDLLILTKALGTGVVATALKQKIASEEQVNAMVESMIQLNRKGSEIAQKYSVNAMTDVTGYGLAGHLLEVMDASHVNAEIWTNELPVLPGARHWISEKVMPAGLKSNYKFYRNRLCITESVGPSDEKLLADPQTSGGLLISLPEKEANKSLREMRDMGLDQARIIGKIMETDNNPILSVR